jgi:pilus assembly protein Flp/PilA
MQMSKVFAFLKDESGATAIEYGLIAAGISVVIITAVQAVGGNLNGAFATIASKLQSVNGSGSGGN